MGEGGERPERRRMGEGGERPELPEFCDFLCPHASFPAPEATGACRTVAAVHCALLGELVPKHAPCAARRRQGASAPG